ncbi:MAG: FAD-dependent oxidoreductase [Verrucomicrobia bacterium]|nr:FAD-dependent oxidoreductase [Verrucomicrobiota bacterium]
MKDHHRRNSLKGIAIREGNVDLKGCEAQSRSNPSPRHFSPVRVSKDRIIRRLAGVRPYRPEGFVVKREQFEEKVVVHNYGHGGGGLSLSWGTAHLAMEEALAAGGSSCAVLGCGAVGLATAILMQKKGWKVTIYAKDLPPETTSNVAGGQWTPTSVYSPDEVTPAFRIQFCRASRLAYGYFQALVGDYYGVRWTENFWFEDKPFELPDFFAELSDLYQDLREVSPEEHPFPRRYGYRFTTPQIETPHYLNAILRDYRCAGGNIVVKTFHEPADLRVLPEAVVINCTGLGSKTLFDDSTLRPVKGQLTFLQPQPEIDYILTADQAQLYMMPRRDGILLGGSFEDDVSDLQPTAEFEERVIAGHRELFNALE